MPVKITDAESIPIGTIVVDKSIPWIAVKGDTDPDYPWESKNGQYSNYDVLGDTALIPVEVDEQFGAEMEDILPNGNPMTVSAKDRDQAVWQMENNPHLATGRIMSRIVSEWVEA